MKKIIVIITIVLLICGCRSDLATDKVKNYFSMYHNLNEKIKIDLNNLIKEESLNEEQSTIYREIMFKQYKDLKYEIELETYNGDEAIISTKINVYDLYKPQKEAEEYRNKHNEEFKDYNDYLKFKLDKMKNTTERIDYTILIKVTKNANGWVLGHITTETLEKIHGIYNYEQD